MYAIAVAAFVLLWLGDLNDYKLKKQILKVCFPAGVLLLAAAAVLLCIRGNGAADHSVVIRIIAGIIGAFSLWAEIYSLFFSFDSRDAYGPETDKAVMVYTRRMYALCRHPGVLFFIILFACLHLAAGADLAGAVLLCVLNVLLIIYEDCIVFPQMLGGYAEYKQEVPFLIPNRNSIRRCIEDFKENT